jgi:hypothetical protein
MDNSATHNEGTGLEDYQFRKREDIVEDTKARIISIIGMWDSPFSYTPERRRSLVKGSNERSLFQAFRCQLRGARA